MRLLHRVAALAAALLLPIVGGAGASPAQRSAVAPLRAAFYYPWFPQAWKQRGLSPYTKYHPSLGFYDSTSPSLIRAHIRAMQYARIQAGISSWWGRGSRSDVRLRLLLTTTDRMRSPFRWTVYYEPEARRDPSPAQIHSDLVYLKRQAAHRSFLRIAGRFVVFVYADSADNCRMTARWKQANTVGAYIVLKVFPGYRACAGSADGWHQYAPSVAEDSQAPYSFSISPGFDKADETAPRLARDVSRWRQEVQSMVASHARFQLITTFNEWGEGTAVESAQEWATASDYGAYLDALHDNPGTAPTPPPPPPSGGTNVLLAAGDIASCSSPGDEATSALVTARSGTVLTLGDNVYESGTPEEYVQCYQPSWGAFKDRTKPAPGNHDYLTAGAAGYFDYFGAAAGPRDKGYYSFDRAGWHILSLNSNCSLVGGCDAGSQQERWVKADLAAHRTRCTLAYWHHPLFSSGEHGPQRRMRQLWQDLQDAGADVVLSGHDHDYERFTPQTADGTASAAGIREFVVGTGGKNHYRLRSTILPNSEVRNMDTFGVLQLTLHPRGYDWTFVPEAGKTFGDAGSEACH